MSAEWKTSLRGMFLTFSSNFLFLQSSTSYLFFTSYEVNVLE